MNDIVRVPSDLAAAIKRARQSAGLSITDVAGKAGRVRDVIYRLEAGQDASVASLLAVLSALQLHIRIEPAGLPTLEEVQRRFGAYEDE